MPPFGTLVGVLIGVAVVLAIATWAHLVYWRQRISVRMPYQLEVVSPTADGSAIELRRLPLPADPAGPPVLLVHGLAANHRNLDVHPRRSLARLLNEVAGRDVWLVTLRTGRTGWRLRERLDFSSMVAHDLPEAIDEVRSRTDAGAVDVVGFSMGGMILQAAIGGSVPSDRVRRAVLIASPGKVGFATDWIARIAPPWFPGTLPIRLPAQLLAFVAGRLDTPFHRFVYDPRQTSPEIVAVAMMDGLADLPSALYAELTAMARAGGALDTDETSSRDRLGRVRVPALFLAGDRDRLAPPAAVRAGFEAWGAATDVDKRWLLLGDDRSHYGHGDLTIGARLEADVFGPVAAFLGEPG